MIYEILKAVVMAPGAMIRIPDFMKACSGSQKFMEGGREGGDSHAESMVIP
jgi:hypothetical protein